jgi:hypothetical protein
MATVYKVLAQSNPTVTTNTNIYTVPSSTSAVVSTFFICNQTTSQQTYRIAIRPAGATLETKHYISYDTPIQASDTAALTLGITLAATDVVTVYASTGSMSFTMCGAENS